MNETESLYQTAMAAHRAGRLEEAEAGYLRVLDRDRFFARAWHLLGVAAYQRGDAATAVEYIERAIGLEPQWTVFYNNLGTIYSALGRASDAERVLRQSLATNSAQAATWVALGHILAVANRSEEALSCFQQALALEPSDAAALAGLGLAYSELGYAEESIAAYQRAAAQSGDANYRVLAAVQLPLVYSSRAEVYRWRRRLEAELDALLAEGLSIPLDRWPAMPIFSLPHQGCDDLAIQRKLARLYRAPAVPSDLWQPRADGRIRVGFISSYFQVHTIGKLTRGLITHLDRSAFQVTVFSVGAHEDAVARELAAAAERYVVLPHDLPRARRMVLENAVDVLVYTDLGMAQTTYSLAFSRLAPVQCTTWGASRNNGLGDD